MTATSNQTGAGPVAIIGAGGHARELCLYLLNLGVDVRCFVDRTRGDNASVVAGRPVIGEDELDLEWPLVNGIGLPHPRSRVVAALGVDLHWQSIAAVGASSAFAVANIPGLVLAPGAIVTDSVSIGSHVHFNLKSSASHDCVVGDFSTLAPGATLCGEVTVGQRTLIGANAVVLPGVRIGSDAVVGAGTVVMSDVEDGQTVVGNPGRVIHR